MNEEARGRSSKIFHRISHLANPEQLSPDVLEPHPIESNIAYTVFVPCDLAKKLLMHSQIVLSINRRIEKVWTYDFIFRNCTPNEALVWFELLFNYVVGILLAPNPEIVVIDVAI